MRQVSDRNDTVQFNLIRLLFSGVLVVNVFFGFAMAQESSLGWAFKENREAMVLFSLGKVEEAIQEMEQSLAEEPGNQEVLFGLAVAYGKVGDPIQAKHFMDRAEAAGLPPGRWIAGPLEWVKSLKEMKGGQEVWQGVPPEEQQAIHGPMLGKLTSKSVSIWIRCREEKPMTLEWGTDPEWRHAIQVSGPQIPVLARDHTLIFDLANLEENTTYYYRFRNVRGETGPSYSFRTYSSPEEMNTIRVGFGGGAAFQPRYERMWDTIRNRNLDGFFFLGDNVYIDQPTLPDVQRYCYYRRQSQPQFRHFTSMTPIFAIWDDHDFIDNDLWGGPEIEEPSWKRQVWNVFRQNFVNPGYGGGERQPGCWFQWKVGRAEFFCLDGRYYREDPKGRAPSMLGPVQKEWLFHALEGSKAEFKVIASPVCFAEGVKPGSKDTWDGYAEERKELFDWISAKRIEGVVLISADRHRSDAWRIDRGEGQYDLFEFESSRLTNLHTHEVRPNSLFGYNEKCSFGELTFAWQESGAVSVTYRIWSIDGEEIASVTIPGDRLKFPR